jgi:hypothetical protein
MLVLLLGPLPLLLLVPSLYSSSAPIPASSIPTTAWSPAHVALLL